MSQSLIERVHHNERTLLTTPTRRGSADMGEVGSGVSRDSARAVLVGVDDDRAYTARVSQPREAGLVRANHDVVLRRVRDGDYEYVIARLDEWWGGRHMVPVLPRLFFMHFDTTTVIAADASSDRPL